MINSSFRKLLATQFLTVFNDNLFKQTVLLIAVASANKFEGMQSLAQALFSLPFMVFAAAAGNLSDRLPKNAIIVYCKYIELVFMLIATASLYLENNNLLLICVFLMGTQSAFLGPAKYGIIRDYCTPEQIPHANGLFQASVLLAILIGTGSAGHLETSQQWWGGLFMATVAWTGILIAKKMPLTPVKNIEKSLVSWNPITLFKNSFSLAKKIPSMPTAIFSHACFWLCGSWMLLAWNELLAPNKNGIVIANLDKGQWSLLLASLSIAMGLGAFTSGYLNKNGYITKKNILLGSTGMVLALFFASHIVSQSYIEIWASLLAMSFFAGLYIIPLKSFIQIQAPSNQLGKILGLSQMVDFTFIFIASATRPLLKNWGYDAQSLFLCCALVMLIISTIVWKSFPKQVLLK
jgi:hypothetical protein